MHCECRIRYVFSDKLDYHWCRICILVARNEANGHRHLFLSVINIDREKEADYERWSIVNTDPSTGLLTRLAFEKRISVWTSKNRLERDPMLMPVLAVTVIAIDEMNHAESMIDDSMEATSVVSAAQSIKAFVRPDEISCRYGPNEFAIVLKDAGDDTLLKERLHMLYSALVSKLEGDADAVINIGYVILDCEADFKVQALKKAQYAMNLARKKEKNRCVQFSESIKSERLKRGKDSDQNIEESGNDICVCAIGEKQVFIRTCGAFDVFADEKAILFSHAKSKELLALLVDRRGGYVAAKEAIAKLWEDDIPYSTKMNRYRKASMFLKETLSEHGVEYILETFKKKRRINTASIDCDYYQFVSDEWTTAQFIPNSYLPEYSWAESSIAFLEAIRRQRHQTAKP